MSFGFSYFNDSLYESIDTVYPNYALYSSGSISTSSTLSLPNVGGVYPLVLIQPPVGLRACAYTEGYSLKFKKELNTAHFNVAYQIYVLSAFVPPDGTYGLVTYDSTQTVVFDSRIIPFTFVFAASLASVGYDVDTVYYNSGALPSAPWVTPPGGLGTGIFTPDGYNGFETSIMLRRNADNSVHLVHSVSASMPPTEAWVGGSSYFLVEY